MYKPQVNKNLKQHKKGYIRVLLVSILMFYITTSCQNTSQEYINLPYNRETTPTLKDDSVTMLISDSGVVRYKMITPEWRIFDRSADPNWYFPQGVYLEQFDTLLNKEITIVADTAWNYTQRRTWRLKGHVLIKNIKEETFKTEEVFYDEYKQKIYSDKYIQIFRPDKLTLQGVGFESNTNMTKYRIFRPFDSNIVIEDTSSPADEGKP